MARRPKFRFEHSTGPRVLLALRDGGVKTWAGLCRVFGYDPTHFHSGHVELRDHVETLEEAGLVETHLERIPGKRGRRGKLWLLPAWDVVHEALGVSLKGLANASYDPMFVSPLFGLPTDNFKGPHVFVLMPFAPNFNNVYASIRAAARKCSLTVGRADDIFSVRRVMDDIWQGICAARLLVADCTGRNPNVFYEVGAAHAIGKAVILITQSKRDVPSDVAQFRYVKYTNSRTGLRRLRQALAETLQRELGSL